MEENLLELFKSRKNLTDRIIEANFSYQNLDKFLEEINSQIEKIDNIIKLIIEKE